MMKRFHAIIHPNLWAPLTISITLSAGGSLGEQDGPPTRNLNAADIEDAVPRYEPPSQYGNPASYVVSGRRYFVMDNAQGYVARGTASWYGTKFHGKRTSSGEPYDMYAMTAAHTSLPLPTYVEVKNLQNQRSAIVKVNDRGPFHDDRLIDLSYAAAVKLGIARHGTAPVEVKAISVAPVNAQQPTARVPMAMDSQFVQVGAFADRGNAERLQEEISLQLPFPVMISNNNAFYRVRIGPFNDRDEVQAAQSRLTELGYNDVPVVNGDSVH